MTIAELCVFAAVLLTIVSVMPVKLDGLGVYANPTPRDPAFYRLGCGREHWARN